MRQTQPRLKDEDRQVVEDLRRKGVHRSREVARAHILASLDAGLSEAQIMAVLGVGRTAVWRTRAAYLDGGLSLALSDLPHPGQPPHDKTSE